MKPLVIYHAGCADGFGAAVAFCSRYPNAELFPGVYQEYPPDVTGRDVFMVDFSYPKLVLECVILPMANSVTIIDHHRTAIESLADLVHPKLTKVFDYDHSGAVMTWRYCWPQDPVPDVLLHIEDRDLWHFALDGTNEVCAYLYSLDFELDQWLPMLDEHKWNTVYKLKCLMAGEALIKDRAKKVKGMLKYKREMKIGGISVYVVNAPHFLASEVGHELGNEDCFAATYYDTADNRIFSLRSSPEGMDVSWIASQYGGGGHKHAAGFKVSLDKLIELDLL